jgi:glyceraldehyde-3-phosphate dehydrogenase/erythrose-4-phosphate dehydrogenase
MIQVNKNKEAAEKEVQDTSCRESGGVPQIKKIPQDWGIRGLIETITAVS